MAQPLSPSGVALGLINKYDGDLAVSIHQQDLEEDDSCDFDEDLAASLQQQELEDNGSSCEIVPHCSSLLITHIHAMPSCWSMHVTYRYFIFGVQPCLMIY